MTQNERLAGIRETTRRVLDVAKLDTAQLSAVHHAVAVMVDEVPYIVAGHNPSSDVFAVVATTLEIWEQVTADLATP